MARGSTAGPTPRWVSVSELAEYTYCPRAWWYRAHPPGAISPESRRASQLGTDFHDRRLAAVEWRDRRSGWLVVAALVFVLLLALALVGLFAGP